MPTIRDGADHYTVIVTVDAAREVLSELSVHARVGLGRFPAYPGYVGGALHVSEDGERMVQYLQWRSEEEFRACVDDPVWESLPSTATFLDAVSSGQAHMDLRSFHVVAVSPPTSADRDGAVGDRPTG